LFTKTVPRPDTRPVASETPLAKLLRDPPPGVGDAVLPPHAVATTPARSMRTASRIRIVSAAPQPLRLPPDANGCTPDPLRENSRARRSCELPYLSVETSMSLTGRAPKLSSLARVRAERVVNPPGISAPLLPGMPNGFWV
jgi:hypothetical protein